MNGWMANVVESGALWALLLCGLQVAGLFALFNVARIERWHHRRKDRLR